MKILFSPSELKSEISGNLKFDFDLFLFKELKTQREFVFSKYLDFINSASNDELKRLFGVSKFDTNFDFSHAIKAILRYQGVAYNALKYSNLPLNSQSYIDENMLIFSNLFGILRADTPLPNYKLKQGEKIGAFDTAIHFKDKFSKKIDEYLKDEFIIDLRAGYYEKFYTIKQPYHTLKFIKNKKVISHYAKHFRGKFLRELALNLVQTKSDFENLKVPNLRLIDIKHGKFKMEYSFEILEN